MADRITGRIEGKEQNLGAPGNGAPPTEASTVKLIEVALKETRELVRIEFALAKLEAKQQLKSAIKAAVGFGVAAFLAMIALSVLAVALVLALGGTAMAGLLAGLAILVLGAIAAGIGFAMLPSHPLERTRHNLEADYRQLKEHVA